MHENKTIQDNIYASFTFGKDEFIKYRRNIRNGTGQWKGEYGKMETDAEQKFDAAYKNGSQPSPAQKDNISEVIKQARNL